MYFNVESERVRQNLSQEQLVEKLGVTRKTYYTWIVNEKIPSCKLAEMTKIFKCSADYLLGLSDIRNIVA